MLNIQRSSCACKVSLKNDLLILDLHFYIASCYYTCMLYGFLFPVFSLWIYGKSFVLFHQAKVDVNKDGNGANIFAYAFDLSREGTSGCYFHEYIW